MSTIPGMVSASGQQGTVVTIRIQPGTDLVEGIQALCEKHEFRAATVNCCIGSLREATFVNAAPIDDGKTGYGHGKPYSIPLVQILSAQGVISKEEDGQYRVHLHGVVIDTDNRIHGGHFVKGGNPVLLTVEMTLTELRGVRLVRRLDPAIGRPQLSPEEDR